MLVAETDESGAVACVWVKTKGHKATRPFNSAQLDGDWMTRSGFSGAPPEEILRWIEQRTTGA